MLSPPDDLTPDFNTKPRDRQARTAEYPYDVVVVAVLLAASDRLGKAITVTSDGRIEDWEKGFRLASAALNRDLPIRLIGDFGTLEGAALAHLEKLEFELNFRQPALQEAVGLEAVLPEAVRTVPRSRM